MFRGVCIGFFCCSQLKVRDNSILALGKVDKAEDVLLLRKRSRVNLDCM